MNTRERLIDIARQIIVIKGIENTTMSDIANASDKGRRTLYTYFKSKEEIYDAVLKRETELKINELNALTPQNVSASEKLERFLLKRFDNILTYMRTPPAKLRFYRRPTPINELKRIQRVRERLSEHQDAMLDDILRQGIENGEFDPRMTANLRPMLNVLMRGIDLTYLSQYHKYSSAAEPGFEEATVRFVIDALKLKKEND